MSGLKRLLSRALAFGLFLAALALLWFGAVEPLRGQFDALADERSRLLELRDRYRRAAAGVAALAEQRDRALASYAEHPALLEAGGAAAAAATMQSELKRVVEAAGGDLRRVVVAPPQAGEAAERIGLKALATMDLAGLRALLLALEIENPQYRIGDLRVEQSRAARRSEEKLLLAVRFDLFAYRRRPAAQSAGGGAQAEPAPAFRRVDDG